jgi:hypothetical protein
MLQALGNFAGYFVFAGGNFKAFSVTKAKASPIGNYIVLLSCGNEVPNQPHDEEPRYG